MSSKRPDRLILVFDADSGFRALLVDVLKKVLGREDCSLCEITYAPVGKRGSWAACEKRLGIVVDELHRDQLPASWGISARQLPCVLARVGDEVPFLVLSREEIEACRRGGVEQLERSIVASLDRPRSPP